ncbi:MAG: class II aldolase/adducin family protein, partial [Sphingomonadaceae bacterium]|nr:class II aldolase/adducin family protein [Sphingomonadaceae bacterium]
MATQLKEPESTEMTDEERQARLDLAAAYRIFALEGWDENIFNHITLKVPGEDGAFLI